ncbi:prepilin-type N-terminal cleavage/methylation domain-containing protein [Leifsonia sp. C5G2]|uniref:type IV pilus modification PilV family protein n=1 Tax=Leifsonia sp. C5G2 TaxID=2735269 RepID=UPI001584C7CB|nr:prepilin-type N-terminal cleavage/methylation domain-containing protein [Leifsonia sp. C5G2]NUU06981.1 prepilin-type N-terminal cleavage/methylation domain-containing protein [Leifsonia sp. C5G2]
MKALFDRLRTAESGVSLIEVIVAMMIFAIISVGVAYSLLSAFTITGDSRARAVATNLAAQEVDLDRSSGDFFGLQSTPAGSPKLVQVPAGTGVTYSIARTVSLVYNSGSDVNCNASAPSSLLYKRIHIAVSWPKMIGQAVVADTVIAPSTKISVDTLGTILVSTRSSGGTPVSGVGVAVSPDPGSVPSATDSMGCSYVLKVPPGTYTVTVSKSNFLDPFQNAAPSTTVTVKAGQSASAGFTYDQYGTASWSYPSGGTAKPTNLAVSALSTYGVYRTAASSPGSATLFPSTEYTIVAGAYSAKTDSSTGCLSPNPADWGTTPAGGGKQLVPVAAPTAAFAPGGSASIGTLPLKTVTITNVSGTSANLYLRATSAASWVAGDPGCFGTGLTQTVDFSGALLGKSAGSKVTIQLPFGAWKLTYGTTSTPVTAVPATWISAPTGVTGITVGTAGTGTVTLDPRVVQ